MSRRSLAARIGVQTTTGGGVVVVVVAAGTNQYRLLEDKHRLAGPPPGPAGLGWRPHPPRSTGPTPARASGSWAAGSWAARRRSVGRAVRARASGSWAADSWAARRRSVGRAVRARAMRARAMRARAVRARAVRARAVRAAAVAAAEHGQVTDVGLEPMLATERAHHAPHGFRGDFRHLSAVPADEVHMIGLGREVIGRSAVAEVGVGDQAELLEQLERAVDRGDVHTPCGPPYLGADVLRRRVFQLVDRFEHELPLRRDTVSPRPELLVPRPGHGPSLRPGPAGGGPPPRPPSGLRPRPRRGPPPRPRPAPPPPAPPAPPP